jgi:hypothetical protein
VLNLVCSTSEKRKKNSVWSPKLLTEGEKKGKTLESLMKIGQIDNLVCITVTFLKRLQVPQLNFKQLKRHHWQSDDAKYWMLRQGSIISKEL